MNRLISSLVAGALLLSSTPVLAQTGSSSSRAFNGACVSTAVEKRDTAVGTAFTTFASTVSLALTTRKDSLVAAWKISDKTARTAAIKTAYATYTSGHKVAKETLKKSKKTAWSTFKTEVNACKIGSDATDTTGESLDNQL